MVHAANLPFLRARSGAELAKLCELGQPVGPGVAKDYRDLRGALTLKAFLFPTHLDQ